MKQNSLKRLLNLFKIIAIITILIFSILPRSINANPIGVDRCNDMCPLPYEESSVYLKSEKIEVTFYNKAKVKAFYTFKNDAKNEIHLTILLPFKTKPSNLNIAHDNKKIDYTWTKLPQHIRIRTTLDISNWMDYNENINAVTFNLFFNENESKTISVKYNRHYYKSTLYPIHYNFVYIVSTSWYWHHKIESAEFVFKVPKNRFDDMRSEGYQITSDNKYIIATKIFENTTFNCTEIKFEWTKDKDPSLFEENKAICLVLILITVAIPLIVFYGLYKNCKEKDQSKGRRHEEI